MYLNILVIKIVKKIKVNSMNKFTSSVDSKFSNPMVTYQLILRYMEYYLYYHLN